MEEEGFVGQRFTATVQSVGSEAATVCSDELALALSLALSLFLTLSPNRSALTSCSFTAR